MLLYPSSICLVPRIAQESACALHCIASCLRLSASCLLVLTRSCCALILALHSSILLSQSPERTRGGRISTEIQIFVPTHFTAATVYTAVTISNVIYCILSVTAELFRVRLRCVSFVVHLLLHPLQSICLIQIILCLSPLPAC